MEILKFVSEYEGFTLDIGLSERIQKWMQPCRLERIQNREEKVVLDVCHNIDGFKAVIPAL
jgi:folylpolyglutamate synthase/dihydropteroate synthase